MGNNYEIRRNPDKPDSKAIRKRQDFDALLNEFNANPPVKSRARLRYMPFYAISVAAAIALVLTFVFVIHPRMQKALPDEKAYFAARPFVLPPLKDFKTAPEGKTLNVNQGGVFEYESGSRLVVPVAAFMDDRGRLVEGEVEIYYQEINDIAGLFLSGIPMTYDSAGVRYNLESSGMVEVYAVQNGQRLQMAPGKSIQVELVSQMNLPPSLQVPPGFNVYQLDSAARAWVYQDIDMAGFLGENALPDASDPLYDAKLELRNAFTNAEQQFNGAVSQLESTLPKPVEPPKPQKADGNLPTLELDFLNQELATRYGDLYQGAIWQLSSKNQNLDERAFRVAWEDSKLKQLSEWEYELTLIHGQNQLKLIVNPVLTGDDYNRALTKYETALADYKQQLAQREAALKSEKDKLAEQKTTALRSAEVQYKNRLDELRINGVNVPENQALVSRKVINRFEVHELGIWNCARPLLPAEQGLSASFTDQDGNELENLPAYLVDKGANTIVRFLAADGVQLSFNRNSENVLLVVTGENRIAIAGNEVFGQVPADAKSFTFNLKDFNGKATAESDIRKLLIRE